MTPDDLIYRHDEQLKAQDRAITAMREEFREEQKEIKRAVYKTGEACSARIAELEDKIEAKRIRNELTWPQRITVSLAALGIIAGPLVTILSR